MFKCHICGSKGSRTEYVNEIFNISEKLRLVENVPATVCDRCEEALFSSETAENIRVMLNGEDKPVRSVFFRCVFCNHSGGYEAIGAYSFSIDTRYQARDGIALPSGLESLT